MPIYTLVLWSRVRFRETLQSSDLCLLKIVKVPKLNYTDAQMNYQIYY